MAASAARKADQLPQASHVGDVQARFSSPASVHMHLHRLLVAQLSSRSLHTQSVRRIPRDEARVPVDQRLHLHVQPQVAHLLPPGELPCLYHSNRRRLAALHRGLLRDPCLDEAHVRAAVPFQLDPSVDVFDGLRSLPLDVPASHSLRRNGLRLRRTSPAFPRQRGARRRTDLPSVPFPNLLLQERPNEAKHDGATSG